MKLLACKLCLQLSDLYLIMLLHGLELSRQLLNDLDGLFSIAFTLRHGLLFSLLLLVELLLQLYDLVGPMPQALLNSGWARSQSIADFG